MSVSIDIQKLSKQYAKSPVKALDALTLQVGAGEVYGFLGANGAGKTTTIRMLMNFIQPTSGAATIMGLDSVSKSVEVRNHVGYLSGEIAIWPKVTGYELFEYLLRLQGTKDRQYLEQLITRFEAEPQKKIGELSKGNRQKIGIIQALMHQPDVLILDEPTSGLDPLMQEVFYDCVREAAERGAAVFVSSHNLAEAQRMCDRVGIIKHGRLIHEQAVKTDTNFGAPVFRVVLKDAKQAAQLAKQKDLKILSSEGTVVTTQPKTTIAAALKAVSTVDIAGFTTQQLNLEDEFLEYYGDGA